MSIEVHISIEVEGDEADIEDLKAELEEGANRMVEDTMAATIHGWTVDVIDVA